MNHVKNVINKKTATREAYERFKEGFSNDRDDYLDLPLELEEQLIIEYKKFLGL